MPLQDAIHEAQFAVTQAEELLDLARGRLAKAKKEFLDAYLEPAAPPASLTLVSAGFTMRPVPAGVVAEEPEITCGPCRTSTSGAHHVTDPQCTYYSYRKEPI